MTLRGPLEPVHATSQAEFGMAVGLAPEQKTPLNPASLRLNHETHISQLYEVEMGRVKLWATFASGSCRWEQLLVANSSAGALLGKIVGRRRI